METKTPIGKKGAPPVRPLSLPIGTVEVIGVFNGLHVVVSNVEEINRIYDKGNFGKGSLSRGAPVYHVKKDDIPRIIWEQQYNNDSKWSLKVQGSHQSIVDSRVLTYQFAQSSINKFWESVLSDTKQVQKRKERKESCVVNKNVPLEKITSKNCPGFLHPSEDYIIKVDEPFKKMVDKILETKKTELKISKKSQEEVIVINIESYSCSNDLSLENINAKLKKRNFPILENLNLNLEEAFFLNFALGCLKIVDTNKVELKLNDLWQKFCSAQRNFCDKYVVYHYYRSKGWVVRSGLKYGGDYLLYKDGPAYNHASYLVKILKKETHLMWKEFFAINRLVETFNKDIIFCRILNTETSSIEEQTLHDFLQTFKVQEVISRRWFPTKDRIVTDET